MYSETKKTDTMQPSAISLQAVSKKYQLYESLKHRVYEALHPFSKKYHREFWALRDITLDIPQGATVGILGINGSGKSTLLQIICSILQPTTGTVAVRGKVAALIELGAGFNPELTGRENAELNCAIMGLDGDTVRRKLPQIEAFADIGEFFDQPVKTYSSGMFMRVAFATAISVEPDILVIDEALAVGDARFQQKCFRKFRDLQSAGKTILLVTHDRSAVPRLCSHALLLHHGRILRAGQPKEVTEHYSRLLTQGEDETPEGIAPGLSAQPGTSSADEGVRSGKSAAAVIGAFLQGADPADKCPLNPLYNPNEFAYGIGGAAIVDFLIVSGELVNPSEIESGQPIEIYVRIRFDDSIENPLVGFSIKTREGTLVYGTHSGWLGVGLPARSPGELATYQLSVVMTLGEDDWFIDLAVAKSQNEVMHAREALIHLKTTSRIYSTGIVALTSNIREAA